MKEKDVIAQLKAVLPKITDLFSDKVTVSSLTRAGTTVTAVTSTDHGLTTGNDVNITGAKTPTSINSLTFLDGVATATTATVHDLTEGFTNGIGSDNPQVEVSGANEAEYNGTNALISVPNRTKFTYSVTGTPASPATGSPTLLERFSQGYNGLHEVNVVNSTTFTYQITETPDSPAQGTIEAKKGARISGSINIERTQEAYTKKETNQLWAFVVLGDIAPSKDRNVLSDATDIQAPNTEVRRKIIMPFSVFVFVPTTGEISGRVARDLMEDVRPLLYKSLLRVNFTTGLQDTTDYGVVSEGDLAFSYNGAIYIHQFVFSTVADVVYDDTVDPDNSVAFRDVELNFLDEFDVPELTANVNLDEEP